MAMTGFGAQEQPTAQDLQLILDVAKLKALSLGANTCEADEVAQATAIRFFEKWNTRSIRVARARSRNRWEAYIRRVARNIQWDLIRSHQRRLARETKVAGRNIPVVHRNGTISAPETPAGVDSYMARAAIAQIIMELPPKQRAVAVRLCIDELSVNEVAEELGLQPQSVRKNMRAAREAIKKALEEEGSNQRLE